MGRGWQTVNELKRTSTPFDAVICLNGSIPSIDVFEHVMDRPLIAADGAAESLFRVGIVPEFVVGDLDSIDPEVLTLLRESSEIVFEPDQETNDFEKALRFAQTMLWNRCLIVGIHGGDLEHSLNNWSVLTRFGRTMNLVALDRDRFGIPIYDSFAYSSTMDELLSIIPQPHACITTSGLLWPLTAEVLEHGTREGARNRSSAERVEIIIHQGSILFFCDATLPLAPELL